MITGLPRAKSVAYELQGNRSSRSSRKSGGRITYLASKMVMDATSWPTPKSAVSSTARTRTAYQTTMAATSEMWSMPTIWQLRTPNQNQVSNPKKNRGKSRDRGRRSSSRRTGDRPRGHRLLQRRRHGSNQVLRPSIGQLQYFFSIIVVVFVCFFLFLFIVFSSSFFKPVKFPWEVKFQTGKVSKCVDPGATRAWPFLFTFRTLPLLKRESREDKQLFSLKARFFLASTNFSSFFHTHIHKHALFLLFFLFFSLLL